MQQSPLIPTTLVFDLHIIRTEASRQPAAQGHHGDTAEVDVCKWVWLLCVTVQI